MTLGGSGTASLRLPDLHRHLDGSLRWPTLTELAESAGIHLPAVAGGRPPRSVDELRFFRGMGLAAALERFRVTLAVLQTPAAVRRVAAEICDDAAGEGVTTLELRFAPQLHLVGGATMEAIVDAAAEGVNGRAGLILCGLYGEPPGVMAALVACARDRRAVVGIDLAGGPAPGAEFGMADYAPAFARARELGLGRTVHAGEGRPAAEIRAAVEQLGATRIGHGTTLLDDERVCQLVIERGVTIEACLTSNQQTGAIADVSAHPLARWLDAGVRVCVNTDNTLLSGVDAASEHALALALPGMTPAQLARAIAFGHAARFVRP